MNSELKIVDQITRQLDVIIDKDTYEKDYQKCFNKFSKKVAIDGFRKGKAPVSVINRLYGEQVKAYYIEEKMNDYYKFGLEETKANPFSQGSFVDVKFDESGDVIFSFEFETLPENFTYEYKNLEVPFKEEEYNENMLTDTIVQLLKENSEEVPLDENQVVQLNDKIKLMEVVSEEETDYFYVNDDSKNDNLKFPNEKLLQLKINDKFIFNDKEYQLIDAFRTVVPELNDSTAKILGHDSVDLLKESLKKNILDKLALSNLNNLNYKISEAFGKANQENIMIPREYLISIGKRMLLQTLGYDQAVSLIDSLEEEMILNFANRQLPNIIWDLAFDQVAKDNNISLTDEEFDAEISKLAKEFSISDEEFKEKYSRNLDNLKDDLLSRKVLDFIKPYCNIIEPVEEKEEVETDFDTENIEDTEYEVIENESNEEK